MMCNKRGCHRRTFMDTDRCFDHQSFGPGLMFRTWMLLCGLVSIAVLAIAIWAVIELVTWVTGK